MSLGNTSQSDEQRTYDLNNLESVVIQYSIKDANNWYAAAIYDASQLDPDFTSFDWKLNDIPDGMYDIRAMRL